MNELPPANYVDRIATLLTEIDCAWSRNDTLVSSCKVEGSCEAHPDRGECCKNARGVSYLVNCGSLEGYWCAWGDNADESIFHLLTKKLDDMWYSKMAECRAIARALRSVGK